MFTPDRLKVILEVYVARSADADTSRRGQLAQARRAATEAEGRVSRLLELVENGLINVNDRSLKERLDGARLARQTTSDRVRLLHDTSGSNGAAAITAASIEQFAVALREVLKNGDPAFRKAYLRLFVDQVVVGDTDIRMRGPVASLAKAAAVGGLPNAGGLVPSFVRQWRPRRDSNPRPQD